MALFTKPAQMAHGPALVGIFLNIMLYGIMIAQCFYYFTSFRKKDSKRVQAFVLMLLITDTVNTVFNMWWIYDVLINNFADLNALATANWVFATDPALVGITAMMVQLFFAHRVKLLTGNMWITIFIAMTALCSALGGIGTAVAIKFVPHFADFQEFQVVVIIWLIATGVCDIAITVALTWHLRNLKQGFNAVTDDILSKIIRVTVQNGLITTVCAIVNLVVYLGSPTGLHLAFNYPLAKLYTNSVMSSLNSRRGWGYGTESNATVSRVVKPGEVFDWRSTAAVAPRTEVFMDVERHEMVDVFDQAESSPESQWEEPKRAISERSLP